MSTPSKSTFFTYPKVVCLGDSITQNGFSPDGQFVALLADFLIRRCDVMNRGYSGYTSRLLLPLLPQLIQAGDNVTLLIIFVGTNDAILPSHEPDRHVPLDEYQQNMEALIDYARSVGVPHDRIILVTPSPVDETRCKDRTNADMINYVNRCIQVAHSNSIDVIPLYEIMLETDPMNWPRYLIDGLHFTAAGSLLLFESLKPVVAGKLQSMSSMIDCDDDVERSCCQSFASIITDVIHLNVDYWRRLRFGGTSKAAKKYAKP